MFPVAGITAGPNRLKYVKGPQGYPGRNIGLKNVLKSFFQNYFNFFSKFHVQRQTLQLVSNKTEITETITCFELCREN